VLFVYREYFVLPYIILRAFVLIMALLVLQYETLCVSLDGLHINM
jgi:hypothetical protein